MTARPLLLLTLSLAPFLVVAAPQPKAVRRLPANKISIESAAKIILERAARLYGKTSRWKGQIIEPPSPGAFAPKTYQYVIFYARPKKLRIEQRFDKSFYADVLLGKNAEDVEFSSLGYSGQELYSYLQGKTGLAQAEAQVTKANGISLTAKRLPDARWQGIACRRVAVEKRFKPTEDEPVEWDRSESWFTAEGRLVRNIRAIKTKSFAPDFSFADPDIRNSEFKFQNFAPVFGANTFKATAVKTP